MSHRHYYRPGDTELDELEFELEERLLEAHWLLGDDSSAPVELRRQWEEMVVSKGWQVGGQHNHGDEDGTQGNYGDEDERQDNHEGEDERQGSKGESVENGGQGKIGWERARLAVAKRWPGQKVLE